VKGINKFEVKNWLVFLLAVLLIAGGLWLSQNYNKIGSVSILSESFNFPIYLLAGFSILLLVFFLFLEVKKDGNIRKNLAKLSIPMVFLMAFTTIYIGQSIKYRQEIEDVEAKIKIFYQRCNEEKYNLACENEEYPVLPNSCWNGEGSNMSFNCYLDGHCALCKGCKINSLGLADCETVTEDDIANNLCLKSSKYRDGIFCIDGYSVECNAYTQGVKVECPKGFICKEGGGCVRESQSTTTPITEPTIINPTVVKPTYVNPTYIKPSGPKATGTIKPIDITPKLLACGQKGCTNDNQCETGLPNFECDQKVDSSQNVCVRVCKSNQTRIDACTCSGDFEGITCGPIDVNGDSKLNYIDLASFALSYFKKCNDSPYISGSGCGGKDVNGDGIINYIDLGSFAIRYFPRSQNCLK